MVVQWVVSIDEVESHTAKFEACLNPTFIYLIECTLPAVDTPATENAAQRIEQQGTISPGDAAGKQQQQAQQLLQAYERSPMLEMQQVHSLRNELDIPSNTTRQAVDYNNSTASASSPGAQLLAAANGKPLHSANNDVSGNNGAPAAQCSSREQSLQSRLPRSMSSSAVSKFADLSLRAPNGEEQPLQRSPVSLSVSPRASARGAAPPTDPLRPLSTMPQSSSSHLLHHAYPPDQRFPTPPPHPQQSPPLPQPLQMPLASHMGHNQPAQQSVMLPGMHAQHYGGPLSGGGMSMPDAGIASHSPLPMPPPQHTPLSSAMLQAPFLQYNNNALQQIVSSIHNPAQMPQGHPSASPQPPMRQRSPAHFAAASSSIANPMQNAPSIPTWCVVTGLPKATLPPAVPPDGVLNVTHLLPWPPAVSNMLQMGYLGLTLDPTTRESRGQIQLPSVMLMVTQPEASRNLLHGAELTPEHHSVTAGFLFFSNCVTNITRPLLFFRALLEAVQYVAGTIDGDAGAIAGQSQFSMLLVVLSL